MIYAKARKRIMNAKMHRAPIQDAVNNTVLELNLTVLFEKRIRQPRISTSWKINVLYKICYLNMIVPAYFCRMSHSLYI